MLRRPNSMCPLPRRGVDAGTRGSERSTGLGMLAGALHKRTGRNAAANLMSAKGRKREGRSRRRRRQLRPKSPRSAGQCSQARFDQCTLGQERGDEQRCQQPPTQPVPDERGKAEVGAWDHQRYATAGAGEWLAQSPLCSKERGRASRSWDRAGQNSCCLSCSDVLQRG